MEKPILVLDLSGILAIWGTISGSIALLVSYLAFRRDRADIKVNFRKGYFVVGDPNYDPKTLFILLNISNRGRRPMTITKAGYVFLKKDGGAILSDSMRSGSKKLNEGESVDFLVKQDSVDLSEISYFSAYDAVGNTYKKYVANIFIRFLYGFLHLTRIRRKNPVREKSKKF